MDDQKLYRLMCQIERRLNAHDVQGALTLVGETKQNVEPTLRRVKMPPAYRAWIMERIKSGELAETLKKRGMELKVDPQALELYDSIQDPNALNNRSPTLSSIGKLFKTIVVVWSRKNPGEASFEAIADDIHAGTAYARLVKTTRVDSPEQDPDADQETLEFFADDACDCGCLNFDWSPCPQECGARLRAECRENHSCRRKKE